MSKEACGQAALAGAATLAGRRLLGFVQLDVDHCRGAGLRKMILSEELPPPLRPRCPLSCPAQPLCPSANTQELALFFAWVGRMQGHQLPPFHLFPDTSTCMPSAVSTRSKTCPGLWDHHPNTGLTDPFLEGFPVTSLGLGLGLVTYQPHPKAPRRWSLPAGHGAHLANYRATWALPRWAQQPRPLKLLSERVA